MNKRTYIHKSKPQPTRIDTTFLPLCQYEKGRNGHKIYHTQVSTSNRCPKRFKKKHKKLKKFNVIKNETMKWTQHLKILMHLWKNISKLARVLNLEKYAL